MPMIDVQPVVFHVLVGKSGKFKLNPAGRKLEYSQKSILIRRLLVNPRLCW
jgi:hypothetical protein